MLSGMKPPERRSKWDVGDELRGCNLQPGPDKFYLDGDDMHATTSQKYCRVSGVVIVSQGCSAVCCPLGFAMVMRLLVNGPW